MKPEAVVVHVSSKTHHVYVGRGGDWGNPFKIGEDGSRQEVIAKHRAWLWSQIQNGSISLDALASLHGQRLGCYCAPEPCHGDTLAAAAAWAYNQKEAS
jgi:hypothetical protein